MSRLVALVNGEILDQGRRPRPVNWRLLALGLIVAAAWTSGESARVVAEAMSEAYLAVTVFVAGTLALVYGLERVFKTDVGHVLARMRRWQVPAAALMGAFPGCGGAIVIVTQYTKGHVSFGSLVAALTATMGDAMFLLLATEPGTGLAVLLLGLAVGSLSGRLVDRVHGQDFLRARDVGSVHEARHMVADTPGSGGGALRVAWLLLILPGLALGLLAAFQVETDALFGPLAGFEPSLWIGVAGSVVALATWSTAAGGDPDEGQAAPACDGPVTRVIKDTNFISAWVVFAFLAYELSLHFSGFDLAASLQLWVPLVPFAAILVGFLPGCGPQILVTTLYVTSSIPLSAQLGNALSNNGDALFPAIALAPKAAILATLYSAIPAVIVAYGYFLIWE